MNLDLIMKETKDTIVLAGQRIKNCPFRDVSSKNGKHNYVTQMDKEISSYLMAQLPFILPGSLVLSEEGQAVAMTEESYVWVVDPIDGTTNYMYDFQLSAISVALVKAGEVLLAAVYNPFMEEMYWAVTGQGAWLNDRQLTVSKDASISSTLVLVETDPYGDRSQNQTFSKVHELFQSCIDIRITGSAALDLCYLAAGRAGAFFSWQLELWDMAAGYLILKEAGGVATHFDGSPLLTTEGEDIIAGNPDTHQELLGFFKGK